MGRMLVVMSMFFCINTAFGGNINLKGTVKNENGAPISGARVSLTHFPYTVRPEQSFVGITGADGAFSLTGTYTGTSQSDSLVVVARDYRTALVTITSYEKNDISVKLTHSNTWVPSGALEHAGGMVKIRAKGYDFEMGQPNDTVKGVSIIKKDTSSTTEYEQPVHTVYFTYDFLMDTVEVQQGEYDSLMRKVYGTKYVQPTWSSSNGLGKKSAAYSIEWGSAALFCNARSKSQGLPDTVYSYSGVTGNIGGECILENLKVNIQAKAYRLPTEAEWEYACRAGTTTDYYWGKDYNAYPRTASDSAEIDSYAVWDHNSYGLGKGNIIHSGQGLDSLYYGTHEVGKKKPNKYGLYDMIGNLSEWCNDWAVYYTWGAQTDPIGVYPESTVGYEHVIRGGNWSSSSDYLRSTERKFDASDYKYFFLGFRCVISGVSTGVKRADRVLHGKQPSINVSSGRITCLNAAGSEIGIYSLNGKRVFFATPKNNHISYLRAALSGGSYIVKIKSKNELSSSITIVP